jgi:hypothetical protein
LGQDLRDIDIQIMFLGRGVPLRSPHWGRCKTYPNQIQNVFLKDYSIPSTSLRTHPE